MEEDSKALIELRREFHRLAEPGWMEYRTTEHLIKALQDDRILLHYGKEIYAGERLGLPTKEEKERYSSGLHLAIEKAEEVLEGYTGAIAVVETGKEGPTIGFRFDIDALPLKESTDEDHLPHRLHFESDHLGAMHACGHDGHMAIGIMFTKWLAQHAKQLKGKFIVVFQPAEEGVRGANALVNGKWLEQVDYFFGMHIGMGLASGKICVGTEDILATEKIDAIFTGKSAHAGAHPEEGRNAILAAASAVLGLHSLPQDANGLARINVGKIEGGSGRNIVANHAQLALEIRGSNERVMEDLKAGVKRILEGAAIQYGCHLESSCKGRAEAWYDKDKLFHDQLTIFLQNKGYALSDFSMKGSEDVALFLNRVQEHGGKAMHFMLGSDLKAAHHQEAFDFNEEDLITGLDLFKDLVRFLMTNPIGNK
ncbi:amidohydrolase [Atopobacter sp. AH10]|uniref:amidohydrolase n=1 Tax=Atopobacter sp. AH10 TaxID=2315861 RepID=UPI000EF230B1|nr:amidohydrolase [Atopobacter sp. AH10]RLK62786.1 amidohydrolase [Atopobacter sp. AH10]